MHLFPRECVRAGVPFVGTQRFSANSDRLVLCQSVIKSWSWVALVCRCISSPRRRPRRRAFCWDAAFLCKVKPVLCHLSISRRGRGWRWCADAPFRRECVRAGVPFVGTQRFSAKSDRFCAISHRAGTGKMYLPTPLFAANASALACLLLGRSVSLQSPSGLVPSFIEHCLLLTPENRPPNCHRGRSLLGADRQKCVPMLLLAVKSSARVCLLLGRNVSLQSRTDFCSTVI